MHNLNLPTDAEQLRRLKVGDEVTLSGKLVTARDEAHKYLVEEKPTEMKELLAGTFIYHCGPVMKKEGGRWRVLAAGPTTSIREEPYEATVIADYGIAGAIGKGGMGPKTLKALKDHSAVYLHAIGGLATILAESVTKVHGVYKLKEFGVPEAMWVFEVKDFPCIVTMDSHGGSLHVEIENTSKEHLERLLQR